ncbi:MAG: hypothetical protein H6Q80_419 [Deltaproteobacteria bacterium]|nr:hypothetical protein [Deltaproteobacteria bacterium]
MNMKWRSSGNHVANEEKYPADKARNSAAKYTDL